MDAINSFIHSIKENENVKKIQDWAHSKIAFLISKIDLLPTVGSCLRKINPILTYLSQNHIVDKDQKLFRKIKGKIALTAFFNVINLYKNSIPNLFHQSEKFVTVEGRKKSVVVLKIINTVSYIIDDLDTIRRGVARYITAFKISQLATKYLGIIGVIGGTASLALNIKGYSKASKNLITFMEKVKYSPGRKYDKTTYLALDLFLSNAKLSKQLEVDGKKLYDSFKEKIKPNPSKKDLTSAQKQTLKEIIEALKEQLEAKKKDKIFSMIDDAIGIVESACSIAAITNPIFFAVWSASTLSYMAIKHVVTQVKNYQFENRMGLIERDTVPSNLSQRIQDFCKWYFR